MEVPGEGNGGFQENQGSWGNVGLISSLQKLAGDAMQCSWEILVRVLTTISSQRNGVPT